MKTNVIFYRRGFHSADGTEAVWIYDLRAGMPAFGKTNPIRAADFAGFVAAYGSDPNGGAERRDEGEAGRFRRFTRAEIEARGDNLDLSWLRDETEPEDALTQPDEIAAAIIGHLRAALAEVEALAEELGETPGEAPEAEPREAAE